jgi:hypothetical protein
MQIEPASDELNDKKVALRLSKLQSLSDGLFHPSRAFVLLKKTPLQRLSNGVVMIQTDIQERGIYALNIEMQINDKETLFKNYLFLTGVPVTKLLVLFSALILLVIVAIFLNQSLKAFGIKKDKKTESS